VIVLTGLALLAGCSKASPKVVATVTVSESSSRPASSAASVTPSPSTTEVVVPGLGGRCEDLLPVSAVDEALGRPVVGRTAFILGVPEPNIGRLARLNCQYGIPVAVKGKPAPTAQLEIGISLYNSAAQATKRAELTVEDYLSHGASQVATTAGQYPATVLTGYGNPTLVVAAGPRTVAVTGATAAVGRAPAAGLAAVAKAALVATAGFTGPGATGSAASSAPTAAPTS